MYTDWCQHHDDFPMSNTFLSVGKLKQKAKKSEK